MKCKIVYKLHPNNGASEWKQLVRIMSLSVPYDENENSIVEIIDPSEIPNKLEENIKGCDETIELQSQYCKKTIDDTINIMTDISDSRDKMKEMLDKILSKNEKNKVV